MVSIASTVLTVGGTPTVFLPLPTPWPSGDSCTSNIYLHTPVSNPNTFLAWDPLYGASMDTRAQSCLPPQVSSWWAFERAASISQYTALGPTFVCPQAYSAVQTVIVASSLQQIFCCPSQYSLLVPQANLATGIPSQCISTVSSGQTMTYLSQQAQPDAFTATVVMTSTASIFAIPVNGFNFATASILSSQSTAATDTLPGTAPRSTAEPASSGAASQSSSSETPTSTSTAQPTSTEATSQSSSDEAPASTTTVQITSTRAALALNKGVSSSPSLGQVVGICIGVVLGAVLVGAVAYLARKRRKQARTMLPGPASLPRYQTGRLSNILKPEGFYNAPHGFAGGTPLSPKEMPANQISRVYELSNGPRVYELPNG